MSTEGPFFDVYCDESGQTKERFMVIGGILIPSRHVDKVNDTISAFRSETGMRRELKWNRISQKKYPEYQRFVEYFFALNNSGLAHFKCLIVDTHKVNHRRYGNGDWEDTFHTFYYYLLYHKVGLLLCRKYQNPRIRVLMDERNSRYRLSRLRDILNSGLARAGHGRPFVTVEPRKSKQTDLLQLNDLLIGAVGYQKNRRELIAGPRNEAKPALARFIAEQAGYPTLSDCTPWKKNRFVIWNFRLRED